MDIQNLDSDDNVQNIVVYRNKSSNILNPVQRKQMGYIPIKTKVIASGTIDINHIVGQVIFEPPFTRFYNIRKPLLLQFITDNGGRIRKSSNHNEIFIKIKEISNLQQKLQKTIHCISTIQKKFKIWLLNIEERLKGPGIPVSKCVNEECPFTLESLVDIDNDNIITWRGSDLKIYGCEFMALFTLLKNTIGGKNIYKDKYEQLVSILTEMNKIETSPSYRSRISTRKFMIFNEMKNPFTREKFQAELILRLLEIANNKKLIKPRKVNRQPSPPSTNFLRRTPVPDLIGAGIRIQTARELLEQGEGHRQRVLYTTGINTNTTGDFDMDDDTHENERLTRYQIRQEMPEWLRHIYNAENITNIL